jgi:hypothetical protein
MSSSEVLDRPADALARASKALAQAVTEPDRIPDEELRTLLARVVKIYALKAEGGMRTPLPPDVGGLTVTDTMLIATDLLHALNVQMFELAMWQAMSGNCIAPHQRVDAPHS